MAATTDQEWWTVQEALVKGGLRFVIDDIITARETPPGISRDNRLMLAEAFRGKGRFTLTTGDHYFAGFYDGELVIEGKEEDGTLYSIFHVAGKYEVMVGDQITAGRGIPFDNLTDAWDDIKKLTAL